MAGQQRGGGGVQAGFGRAGPVPQRLLQALLAAGVVSHLSGCGLLFQVSPGEDQVVQHGLEVTSATLGLPSPYLYAPRNGQQAPRRRALAVTDTARQLVDLTPAAPLLGHQTILMGGAFSTAASPAGALLLRSSSTCSLSLVAAGPLTTTTSAAIVLRLEAVEDHLRAMAGLPGTATAYPAGCTHTPNGRSPAAVAYAGTAPNGDLVGAAANSSGLLTALRATPAAAFTLSTLSSTAATTVAAVDLDGDGRQVLVSPFVTSNGAQGIGVWTQRADGSFGGLSLVGSEPVNGVIGRFNRIAVDDTLGDGRPDIVAFEASASGSRLRTLI